MISIHVYECVIGEKVITNYKGRCLLLSVVDFKIWFGIYIYIDCDGC